VPLSLTGGALPPREELLKAALESNSSVQRARDEVSVAEAGLGESESRRLPTVNLDGRYINYGSASGANSLEWNVGLSVSYPIFTGGSVGRSIARSQAAERSAVERVKWTEAEVSGQLDRSLSAVEEAIARSEALQVAVSRFEEVTRIEKLRLDTGTGTELDYIRAEADLRAARASLIESRYGEIAARSELARMTGSLSAEWVSTHVRSEP
jgi:outer membrane protein